MRELVIMPALWRYRAIERKTTPQSLPTHRFFLKQSTSEQLKFVIGKILNVLPDSRVPGRMADRAASFAAWDPSFKKTSHLRSERR